MNIFNASLKKALGLLIVFALPLLFTGLSLSRDLGSHVSEASARSIHDESSWQTTDRLNSSETHMFDEPVISIVFDDGWESIYDNAFPQMETMGIKSTQYIITSTFENSRYMSVEQIRHMHRNGHEIQSHTVTHPNLTELSADQLETELYSSRIMLEEITGVAVEDLAVPLGAYNPTVTAAARKWYRTLRTTQLGVNTRATFNPYEIKSPTIKTVHTTKDIKQFIEEAKQNNGWLILTYHQIDTSGDTYAVSPDAFRAQMQAVIDSGVDVVTFGQAIEIIQEQQQ